MQASNSVWSPLRIPLYRAIWIAITASNIGTWMNEVGVTWMMASLVPSNLMLALIQTATTLPFLFLSYPAGALADIFNRRRMLIGLHLWMLLSATVLTVITVQEMTTEWWLLILTLSLAAGNAMMRPAFSASIPAFVDKEDMHKAVTLNSLSTNASKAVGPAAGGLIIALSGPHLVFAINALSFVVITAILLLRFPRTVGAQSELPPERFTQALRGGMVYAIHDRDLRLVLIRCVVFFLFACSFWSLIPALLIRDFDASAQVYGTVMALTGIGSVAGAMLMPRLYGRWSRNVLFGVTSGLYGCGLLLLASAPNLWAVCLITVLMGLAWITSFSALIVTCQLTVPDWVRARALAILMLSYGASATPGSALWGYLADHFSISGSLALAGVGALATVLLGQYLPLNNRDRDHTNAQELLHLRAKEFAHDAGPVKIVREYHIAATQQPAFAQLMQEVGALRKRNGAQIWRLQEEIPGTFMETIVVSNWLEYLRHRERMSVDDHHLESQIAALNADQPPKIRYELMDEHWGAKNTAEKLG